MTTFNAGDLVVPKDEKQREIMEQQIRWYWKSIPTPYFPLVVSKNQGGIGGLINFTNGYECYTHRVKLVTLDKSLSDYM